MKCNTCKGSKTNKSELTTNNKKIKIGKIPKLLFRFLFFLLLLVTVLPFSLLVITYILFVSTVLNKGINLLPIFTYIVNKIIKKEDDEEEELNYEPFDEDEYTLENPNDIIENNN